MRTLIKNTRILLENSILFNHQVVLNDNLIEQIIPDTVAVDSVDLVVDAEGNYLSPGFIDIHNHGNTGFDTMDASFEALEHMANYHLSNGVTSFLATTMTNPQGKIKAAVSNVAEYMKKQSSDTAQLLGIYLEGPYFNAAKKGAQPLADIRDPNIDEFSMFIEASNHQIKVVSLAPELPNAKEMIRYLVNHNIAVAIGHSDSNYEHANDAIQLGATLSTHLYNGMRDFSHREPGIIGASLTNNHLMTEIIADGIHLHKAAIEIAKMCKGTERVVLISDAIRAAGLEDGIYELGGQKVIAKNKTARLENGALAGSTLNLNLAVINMINLFNTNLIDAVKMATINPAKAINMSHQIGSIETGKQADLLIFDDYVTIKHIIKNGKLIQ